MSSHDLGEVDRLCETVAIVRAGRLVQEASIQALRAQHRRRAEVVLARPLPPDAVIPGAEVLAVDGRTLRLLVELDPNPLLGFLAELPVESITIAPPSLNDIFAEYYVQEPARR
jgi:ABC-2 type transport system ATP-binding protein